MKSLAIVTLSLLSLIFSLPVTLPLPAGSSTFTVFVASSPCDAVSRPLLKIPQTADCELIKWNLTLYQHPNTLAPTTYKLNYVYGIPEQGTNGLSQGGTKVERKGKWTTARGTKTDPDAIVYQLNPDDQQEPVSFQMADHNLLHLLDRDGSPMLGNAGWSYTLNRIGNSGRPTKQTHPSSASRLNSTTPTAPTMRVAIESSTLGRFVGRTPCHDVAREVNKVVSIDCTKLKWDLVLYRDPIRGTPTTYKLKGTFYRERIGEGNWAIVKGTKMNPDAVVYQLDPDKPHSSLLLLKVHDDILLFLDKERHLMVGNGDFSYTLNRENVLLSEARPSYDVLNQIGSKVMFKRIDQREWADYICEDLRPVLDFLKAECGIGVSAIGLENVKAPETVIKIEGGLQRSFVEILKREFSSNERLNISESWVVCREHYCMIE